MRELHVGNLLAAAFVFLAVIFQTVRSESGVQSDIESEFAAAVSRAASLRETNRSTAIVVTDLFKEIIEKHQPAEFRAFVASHYKMIRAEDALGNVEFTDLDANSLRKFDRRFFPQDELRIGFRYSADWKYIIETHVSILNDGGI